MSTSQPRLSMSFRLASDRSLSEVIGIFLDSMVGIVSPATITWYARRLPSLTKALGDAPVGEITLDNLRTWRAGLANRKARFTGHPSRPEISGGLSPDTLHTYVRAVRRFCKWMVEEGILEENPAKRLELPRLPVRKRRGIPEADRDKILKVLEGNARDYALARFLADTGCRVGGVVNLRLEDLELVTMTAVVHEKGRGGYHAARAVFYGQKTAEALRSWLAVRGCDGEYLFTSRKSGGLTTSGVYQVLKRAARAAGVKRGFNPHNWRHGAIRGMLSRGLSLPEAAQIAGHSSVTVTGDIYGKFDERELQARHRQTSWLDD